MTQRFIIVSFALVFCLALCLTSVDAMTSAQRIAFTTVFQSARIRDNTSLLTDEDVRNTAIVEINKRSRQSISFLQGKNNDELLELLRRATGVAV